MKRFRLLTCMLLALVLLLSSCSSSLEGVSEQKGTAGQAETVEKKTEEKKTEEVGIHDPTGFAAGFGKVVVNPPRGTGLAGYSNAEVRLSEVVKDDICVSCTAVSDGETKVLLFTVDAIGVSVTNWNQVAKMTEKSLGIPKENIIINASHSHAAPGINAGYNSVAKYMSIFYQGMLEAAEQAVADLDRCELKIARTETQDLSYVRRYIRIEDGKFVGNWPSKLDPAKYKHEFDADTEMLIFCFDRVNQEDIILCNWQCHVTTASSSTGTTVSSDYVGAFRDEVSERLGVNCAFFQGGAGSIIPFGALEGEKRNSDYIQHGKDVAQVLIDALPSLTPVKTDKIKISVDKIDAVLKEGTDANGNPQTQALPLSTFSFGEVAIATAPCEMDHRSGQLVKSGSPFTMTLMSGYSNGAYGYIPMESSFVHLGYEDTSCRYVPGTAEQMSAKLVAMLEGLYGN